MQSVAFAVFFFLSLAADVPHCWVLKDEAVKHALVELSHQLVAERRLSVDARCQGVREKQTGTDMIHSQEFKAANEAIQTRF